MDILLEELFYGVTEMVGLVPELLVAMWRGYPEVLWLLVYGGGILLYLVHCGVV
jgi:hypothetical protein